jgi:hypothetical protein
MATGALAGLVDGFTRGYGLSRQWAREEEDRKTREEDRKIRDEERAYLKEQRDRLRREQAADDDIDRRLSSVPTTTEKWGQGYEWAAQNNAPMRDDEGNVMPGTVSAPRSYRDVAADQAAAVRGIGGRRGLALASQLQQFVNSEDDRVQAGIDRERNRKLGDLQFSNAEIANRQALALEALKRARIAFQAGDLVGALKFASGGYKAIPDGMDLVIDDDGKTVGRGAAGRWVDRPVPITKESVGAILDNALEVLDPSTWGQRKKIEQDDRKITNDSTYQTGMLGIYGARNALDRDEFNAQKTGGMFQRAPTAAESNPALRAQGELLSKFLALPEDQKSGPVGRGLLRDISVARGQMERINLDGENRPRDQVRKEWAAVELELLKQGARPDEIRQQQSAFYARRGVAPSEAENALRAGKTPSGKPLAAADVAEFNRRYPASAVDPAELSWLKK